MAEIQMVLGTAKSTVETAVGSQLSATVSEGDLRTARWSIGLPLPIETGVLAVSFVMPPGVC